MASSKSPIFFGKFLVTPHVFYLTPHSFALVNLKPLLPGHVLVCPLRVTPRLQDLSKEEAVDLFLTVQQVGQMVERVYNATSLNVAMQDGVDAGQSVPHVHMHIIPRQRADLDSRGGNDAIYAMLDGDEGNIGKHMLDSYGARSPMPMIDEAARKPKSEAELTEQARQLFAEMHKA